MCVTKPFDDAEFAREMCAAQSTIDIHTRAIEELRDELSETRADRDRGWARVKMLEERIAAARADLDGKKEK